MEAMGFPWGELEREQWALSLSNVKPQAHQRALWMPSVGQRVEAFWVQAGGRSKLGTMDGKWYSGEVSGLRWEHGEPMPEFRVTSQGGHEEWWSTRWAGTVVRLYEQQDPKGEVRMQTDRVPPQAIGWLGHGTRVQVQWGARWHKGQVVAIDADRGIAIRYKAGGGWKESVAWHDERELQKGGLAVDEIIRRGRSNEEYQARHSVMATGCVLLTDEGRCECEHCVGTWPTKVDEAAREAEEQGWGPLPAEVIEGLKEMGPKMGRAELEAMGPEPGPPEGTTNQDQVAVREPREKRAREGQGGQKGERRSRRQRGQGSGVEWSKECGVDPEMCEAEEEEALDQERGVRNKRRAERAPVPQHKGDNAQKRRKGEGRGAKRKADDEYQQPRQEAKRRKAQQGRTQGEKRTREQAQGAEGDEGEPNQGRQRGEQVREEAKDRGPGCD
jgi:hypothetical protein